MWLLVHAEITARRDTIVTQSVRGGEKDLEELSNTSKGKGFTFAQVHCNAIMDKSLSDKALRIYCYLIWRQGRKDFSWPSMASIGKDLDMSESSAHRHIEELEQRGYLTVEHITGRSNHYTIEAEGTTVVHDITTTVTDDTPVTGDTPTPVTGDTQNDNHLNDIPPSPKKREKVAAPAEIVWVHETIGQYIIPKAAYSLVIPVVQKKRDPDLIKRCWAAWAAKGYKPTNLGWLTEWYASGVIPKNGNGQVPKENPGITAARMYAKRHGIEGIDYGDTG